MGVMVREWPGGEKLRETVAGSDHLWAIFRLHTSLAWSMCVKSLPVYYKVG